MSASTVNRVNRSDSLALYMALRLLGHGENKFARFVTWVSFAGLALGVMVLTVVVTVMNGFDSALKDRLLSSIPHITVQNVGLAEVEGAVKDTPGVLAVHPYFSGLGALTAGGQVQPVGLYASRADGRKSLSNISQAMRNGGLQALFDNPGGLIVGAPLARHLGLLPGDDVVVLGVANQGEGVAPKLLRFTLAGTFELGAELDYSLVIGNLDRMPQAQWDQLGDVGVQIQLQEPLRAPLLVEQLRRNLPQAQVDSWNTTYGELFQAVQLEKSMMFVLLVLVVAIAAFNIIAGQTMVVNDKRGNIAILRTMGAKRSMILRLFLLQGVCISFVGTIIGLGLGLACASYINEILDVLQALTGMHLLDGSFFVRVPVRIEAMDLVIISTMSAGLCLLSAWMPAWRAAHLNPIDALHA